VPQDPDDEPASELLKKIAKEKANLLKAGKLKKQMQPPAIGNTDKLHSVPNGWQLVRFGDAVFNRDAERIPVSVDERKNRKGEYDYYGASGVIDFIDDYLFDKPLLLIGEDGANLISRSTPIAYMARGKYWVNNHAHVLDGISENLLLWICLHINAITLEPYITGTAQPKMNQKKMNSILLAIPPEKEQHRIVAKVDELMAPCDQLEQQTEASISAHQTLVKTLLTTLTNASEHEGFNQAWARIAEHFDTLFTTEWSIDQLKQTILQLAQKPLPPIEENEKPFELPMGWAYTRFDNLCGWITSGSTPPKSEFHEKEGVPYLKVYNIREQTIDFDYKPQFVNSEYHERKLKRSILYPGDVVMNIVGPPLGKIAIIPDTYPEWNCNQAIVYFRPIELKLNLYIYTYLTSHMFLNYIELIGTAGQDNISVTKSRTIVLPMPPIEEQFRIVAKVDELMVLCTALKTRVSTAQATQLKLADTMTVKALN